MAPNFKSLLAKPAGQAKKPEALPAGDYPAKIKSFEQGLSSQKKTPFVRFHLAYTGWPDEIDAEQRESVNADGTTSAIDLTKKQGKIEFYLTDDALHMLDTMLRSLGLSMEGRTYEELIPEAVGADVLAQVIQEVDDRDAEDIRTFNKVKKIVGLTG